MTEEKEDIAAMKVEIEHLKSGFAELRTDVKEILAHVSAAKGSWRTLVVLGGVVTALGGGLAWIVDLVRHP